MIEKLVPHSSDIKPDCASTYVVFTASTLNIVNPVCSQWYHVFYSMIPCVMTYFKKLLTYIYLDYVRVGAQIH